MLLKTQKLLKMAKVALKLLQKAWAAKKLPGKLWLRLTTGAEHNFSIVN